MNSAVRILFKSIVTIIIFIFFGGIFKGCSVAAQTPVGRGLGLLFATIIFIGALYGVWVYKPKKKPHQTDITLKKD